MPERADSSVAPAAAVVLAGGRASRLGGVDKAGLRLDGTSLLEHVLAATAEAGVTVVVGTRTQTSRHVLFALEDPPLGGPAAGLLAGLDRLRNHALHGWVAAVAVDMPSLTTATLRRLVAAAAGHDGAILVGRDGRRQLAAVLDLDRLRSVDPGAERRHGLPIHRLLATLDLAEVAAVDDEGDDIDTWPDLRRPRALGGQGPEGTAPPAPRRPADDARRHATT